MKPSIMKQHAFEWKPKKASEIQWIRISVPKDMYDLEEVFCIAEAFHAQQMGY